MVENIEDEIVSSVDANIVLEETVVRSEKRGRSEATEEEVDEVEGAKVTKKKWGKKNIEAEEQAPSSTKSTGRSSVFPLLCTCGTTLPHMRAMADHQRVADHQIVLQ